MATEKEPSNAELIARLPKVAEKALDMEWPFAYHAVRAAIEALAATPSPSPDLEAEGLTTEQLSALLLKLVHHRWHEHSPEHLHGMLLAAAAKAASELSRLRADLVEAQTEHTDMMWQRRRADERAEDAVAEAVRLRAELDEARLLLKSARHHVESEGDATLLTVIDADLKEGTP